MIINYWIIHQLVSLRLQTKTCNCCCRRFVKMNRCVRLDGTSESATRPWQVQTSWMCNESWILDWNKNSPGANNSFYLLCRAALKFPLRFTDFYICDDVTDFYKYKTSVDQNIHNRKSHNWCLQFEASCQQFYRRQGGFFCCSTTSDHWEKLAS